MSKENSQQQGQGQKGSFIVFRNLGANNSSNNNNSTPIDLPDPNRTMSFGNVNRTYKEIAYGSRLRKFLNLSVEVLTNESTTSRLARRNERNKVKKIPRPQNAWIIYRRNKSMDPEFKGKKSSIVSSKIQEMWHNESTEVREYFTALSLLALENHNNKYGDDYKYRPKQTSSKKPKVKNEKSEVKLEESRSEKHFLPTPAASPEPETSTMMSPNTITAMPLFFITPSSPEFTANEENQYFPTPATSNQHSPITFENNLSELTSEDIMDWINNADINSPEFNIADINSPEFNIDELPTPATSSSPLTIEQDFLELMNQGLTPLFDFSIPTTSIKSIGDNSFPPLSSITRTSTEYDDSSMNVPLFYSPIISTNDELYDLINSMQFTDAPLYPDQMDFFNVDNVNDDQPSL